MSANQAAPPVLPLASFQLFWERLAIHPIALRPLSDRTQIAISPGDRTQIALRRH